MSKASSASAVTQGGLTPLLDAAGLGLWWLDPDADRMEVTETCRGLCGFRDLVVGFAEWLGMLDAGDRAAARAGIVAAMAAGPGGSWRAEFGLTGADGRRRVLSATAQSDAGADGRPRMTGLFRDITAERAGAAALLASEARFRAIANAMPQMVWSTLPDGFHDYYNDRWYEFTGVPYGSTDGEGWNDMFHPEDQPRAWQKWRHSLQTGEPYEIEYRLRRHDGAYRWTLGRALPVRDEEGRITRWMGTCTDIQELVEARELLANREAELAREVARAMGELDRIFATSSDLILVMEEGTGRFLRANPAFTRVLGWRPEELVGRTLAELVHPEDLAATGAEVRRLGRGGRTEGFLNRYRHRDGSWREVSWTAVAEEGLIYGLGRDVTEQRAAADRLRETQEQLMQLQKLESIGQLTGGVAHDVNNLLTPIMGALDLLRRRLPEGDRGARLVTAAQEAAERAKILVARLLAFARRQHLEPQAVDVAALVQGMRELIRRSIGPRVETVIETPKSLDFVRVDPNQLELAILNLAVNARDAMPDGGRLTISARVKVVEEDGPGELTPGRYVRLRVADTGIGMDAETARKAVEPFFTTKGVGQGTGLGLSMVHGLAAQSGGMLSIESEPGRGTRIDIWLPVTEAMPRGEFLPEETVAPAERRMTILVVDDEELVRGLTAAMLEEMGHEVVEVGSAARALAVLRDRPEIELVLTDYLMPGMTGVDLSREVARLRPGLPVLLMTGYANLAPGADGGLPRLAKPFKAAELAAKVAEVARTERRVVLLRPRADAGD
jgi:PAS domain S-box-containing protein